VTSRRRFVVGPSVVVGLVLVSVAPAAALSLEKLLGNGLLVVYDAREPSARPSARTLRQDAEGLHAIGFRAVTTHATTPASAPVCRFFKRHGFATVLVGIADPTDAAEVRRAVRLKRCADGYVVGTGGVAAGTWTRDALAGAIARVRQETGRPVTTREPADTLRADPSLARLGDWVFPIVQPWDAGKREGQDACGYVIFTYRDVAALAPAGVPTMVAESGLPTEGAPATSEHYQRAFFLCLESRQVPFGYFIAFDRPDGADPLQAHGGLFRADGSPKLFAAQRLAPQLTVERRGGRLVGRVTSVPRHLVQVVVYVQGEGWELTPPVAMDRHGDWSTNVPAGRLAIVYVAARAWTPPHAVDRKLRADRTQILVEREVPAM
jgi:hypothetical protein